MTLHSCPESGWTPILTTLDVGYSQGTGVTLGEATSLYKGQCPLEIIILSEVSQTEKDKYHMISLICGI